jgi:CubicO group peptidase (beta-lactamase class C family)
VAKLRNLATGVLAVLVIAAPAADQLLSPDRSSLPRSAPEAVGLSRAKLDEATTLLNQVVAERTISGAVGAVARKGKLAWVGTAGLQDLVAGTPMTDRSMFRIYSMTKSVTAVAVMMLHEQGRFRLNDPVSKYLPAFRNVAVVSPDGATRPPTRDITVEDLLLHTSGLSHRTSELYRDAKVRSRSDSLPKFIDNIVRAPLMEDPGTRYRYSESPTVLGRLVEIWSRRPFDEFLSERIFKPLRMIDTVFWVAPADRARLTTVYRLAPGGGLTPFEIEEVPFTERPALLEGAVGLVSTVPDYLRFAQMLLNKGSLEGARLLRPETVERMTANGLPDAIVKARGGAMGWGLANVNVVLDPGTLGYPANRGEYGWDGSAGTIFWVDPGLEMVTILMTQSSPANPDRLRERFKTLVQQAIVD